MKNFTNTFEKSTKFETKEINCKQILHLMKWQVNWRLRVLFFFMWYFIRLLVIIYGQVHFLRNSKKCKALKLLKYVLFSKTGKKVLYLVFSFLETRESFQENVEKCEIFSETLKCLRSIHQRCSRKKAVLKSFAIFTGKHLCWILFLHSAWDTYALSIA